MRRRRSHGAPWLLLLLVAFGFGVAWFVLQEEELPTPYSDAPPLSAPTARPTLSPPGLPGAAREEAEEDLPSLEGSDAFVRELAQGLSSHPRLVAWLAPEDLVLRFVAAVDNVSRGQSPRGTLGFLAPEEDFAVIERDGRTVIDPASYRRYDTIVDVFVSLDTNKLIEIYAELRPHVDSAYRELGYPEGDFEGTLRRAINVVLETPVPSGPLEVEEKVITWRLVDPKLENLPPAKAHLLRTGPKNTRRLQLKLREIAAALDAR